MTGACDLPSYPADPWKDFRCIILGYGGLVTCEHPSLVEETPCRFIWGERKKFQAVEWVYQPLTANLFYVVLPLLSQNANAF